MKKYVFFALGLGATSFLLLSAKKPTLKQDGQGIAQYLVSLGYSKANASGIAGNIYVESRYDPKAIGDNGQSFGLAQWHKTRWIDLIDWSKSKNLNPNNFKTQLLFIDFEFKNKERKAQRELLSTNTPTTSAFAFAKYYERPAFISNERMTKAEEIYKQLK